MRTRYWGLYWWPVDKQSPDCGGWLIEDGSESTNRTYDRAVTRGRKRFVSASAAYEWHSEKGIGPFVGIRPFYVTTKPRKLPPEVQAVIDAVKRYDACGVGWKAVIDALRAYETKC